MTDRACYICKRPGGPAGEVELRPYGERGQDICFECMTADPEREKEAKRQFSTALAACGGGAVIGTEDGPVPLTKDRSQ